MGRSNGDHHSRSRHKDRRRGRKQELRRNHTLVSESFEFEFPFPRRGFMLNSNQLLLKSQSYHRIYMFAVWIGYGFKKIKKSPGGVTALCFYFKNFKNTPGG